MGEGEPRNTGGAAPGPGEAPGGKREGRDAELGERPTESKLRQQQPKQIM